MRKQKTAAMLAALLGAWVGVPHTVAAQDFVFDWAKSVGGTGNENANGVQVDASGNVYVAGEFGEFGGPVDFDPGLGTDIHASNGGEDNYLAKYDSAGNLLWVRTFGNASNDNVRGPALDSAGNVYICGVLSGTVDFDPVGAGDLRSSNGNGDAFLTKYDSDGNYQWTRTWGGPDGDSANGVGVDTSGNIYVAGHFRSTVDFDPSGGDPHSSNGGVDFSVTKYDSNGNYQWTVTVGGTGTDIAVGVVTDGAGNVYVAGEFQGVDVDFDPGPGMELHTSNGGFDVFVAEYDASGNHIWSRSFGGPGVEETHNVGIDAFGHLYVTGEFASTVDFDPNVGVDEHTSLGGADIFFSKYDDSGTYQYTRTFGGTGVDIGNSVTVDMSETIFVSGFFQNTVDFDAGPGTDQFSSQGGSDGFLSTYDAAGAYLETIVVGGTGFDFIRGVGFDAVGNLYVQGGFSNTIDLDPGAGTNEHTSAGGRDFFLVKLSSGDDGDGDGFPDNDDDDDEDDDEDDD